MIINKKLYKKLGCLSEDCNYYNRNQCLQYHFKEILDVILKVKITIWTVKKPLSIIIWLPV